MVGASALGLPFMHSQFKPASASDASETAWVGKRIPLELRFSPEETGVISVLRRRSEGVYMVGGGILGRTTGRASPYLNLVVESTSFGALKDDMFSFGVTPISTPELPSHFIKFVYGGKPFTVLNMEWEGFLGQNALGQKLRLLPLAHNFLGYSVDEAWVVDPYSALECRAAKSNRHRIKLLQEPETAVAGLELCLAVAFDTALLDLEPPVGHSRFEKRVLDSTVEKEKEATTVFHQVLSFFPDLMELRGFDFTRRYLVSPLSLSAATAGPGIDLRKVEASLQRLSKRGAEVSSVQLLAAINDEFCQLAKVPGLGVGFPDYMAAKKLPIRRGDLVADVLRGRMTMEA